MSRVLTSGKRATTDTIERARQRAIAEGIEVRRVAMDSAFWIATSSNGKDAYVLDIKDGRVTGCTCRAGEFGGYCKHRAAWEMAQEAMEASNG